MRYPILAVRHMLSRRGGESISTSLNRYGSDSDGDTHPKGKSEMKELTCFLIGLVVGAVLVQKSMEADALEKELEFERARNLRNGMAG